MACDICGAKTDVLGTCLRCVVARLQAENEPRPAPPPANVRNPSTGLPVVGDWWRDHVPPVHPVRRGRCVLASNLQLAPVRDVGGEREALRSYVAALDASLQAGHQSLQEIGQQSGLTVADVLRLAHEALAENRGRLRVEAGVVSNGNG